MASTHAVRRATPDDLDELLRLRQLMMDLVEGPAHPRVAGAGDWMAASRAFLADGFAAGTTAAFVAEADGVAVGSGVGHILQRLSAPWNPTGRYGYVASMVTEPAWQGRGIGGAVVDHLLAWFTAEGITRVDLTATAEGEPVYRSRGFVERDDLAMRWTGPTA